MALLNLIHPEQLFPRGAYQRAFEALLAGGCKKQACRTMVGLLALFGESRPSRLLSPQRRSRDRRQQAPAKLINVEEIAVAD